MPKDQNDDDQQARGFLAALGRLMAPATQARGRDDDRRQIMADLVSDDLTPFVPDDMMGLSDLSQEALIALREKFLTEPVSTNANKGGDPMAEHNKAGGGAASSTQAAASQAGASARVSDMTVEAFTALVAQTARTAAEEAVAAGRDADRRADLQAKLATNSELGFTADEIGAMPLSALEKMAAKMDATTAMADAPKKGGVNYAGRSMQTHAAEAFVGGAATARKYTGMAPPRSPSVAATTEAKE